MFEQLSEKLNSALGKLRGQGRIKEEDLENVLKEVRINLLEADVNFNVVKEFVDGVRGKALGQKVLNSLTPGEHITKIVYEELTSVLGETTSVLSLKKVPPVSIMIVGLQGSGKTTFCGKLAAHLKKQHRKQSMLVPLDVYRPAAKDQLKTLAQSVKMDFFDADGKNPVKISGKGLKAAEKAFVDSVIFDTAGRLHIDDDLMKELVKIKKEVNPAEVLLVADSMLGQESVNVAREFHERVGITGIVLTKLDGDARGGAALSMRSVTGVPIKFISNGEKLTEMEVFYPDRLASRILDMGDIKSLLEKASETVDMKEAAKLQKKLKKSKFDINDFYTQLQQIKKLGSFESIMGMMPGMGKIASKVKDMEPPEKEFKKIEAIICSMTYEERDNPSVLNGSRRTRIATGSGTTVQDINRFMKQFLEMQKIMKRFGKVGMRGLENLFR